MQPNIIDYVNMFVLSFCSISRSNQMTKLSYRACTQDAELGEKADKTLIQAAARFSRIRFIAC
jgi:hypothetical protein